MKKDLITWLSELSVPEGETFEPLAKKAKDTSLFANTKLCDLDTMLEQLGTNQVMTVQDEAVSVFDQAKGSMKSLKLHRQSIWWRKAGSSVQPGFAAINDFLTSYSGLAEIMKGADQQYGGIAYGMLSLLLSVAVQKQLREDMVEEAFAELALAMPRLETLERLRPPQSLRSLVVKAYALSTLFCRQTIDYYVSRGRRLKDTTSSKWSRVLTQLRTALLEISKQIEIVMLSKVMEMEPRLEQIQADTGGILAVASRWNDDQARFVDVETPKPKPAGNLKVIENAAIFRARMDEENARKIVSEEVEIRSLELIELLTETTEQWRVTLDDVRCPYTIQSPFVDFASGWDACVDACCPRRGDSAARIEARQDLEDLMDVLQGSHTLGPYLKARATILSSGKISFKHLWTLFPHGERVYARSFLGQIQMMEVVSISDSMHEGKIAKITCRGVDWTGIALTIYHYDFVIPEFGGEKSIVSLEVFPVVYGNDSALPVRLKDRGQKFLDLCRQDQANFHFAYTGVVLSTQDSRSPPAGNVGSMGLPSARTDSLNLEATNHVSVIPYNLVGEQTRVIVDNWSFLNSPRHEGRPSCPPIGAKQARQEPKCFCRICGSSPLSTFNDVASEDIPDSARDILEYLPPKVFGYVPKAKLWAQLSIDGVRHLNSVNDGARRSTFDDELVLDQDQKDMLLALVEGHQAPRYLDQIEQNGGTQYAEGKGQGLFIMLHGPPGVGKTMTAETLAERTNRPLLRTSIAEIGNQSQQAKKTLFDIFHDAARWRAILLMDEGEALRKEEGPKSMAMP